MLLSVSVILVLASAVSARHVVPESNIPYGYIRNIAIPKAEQVRIEEERNSESIPRIINGQPAQPGEVPWQAGLLGTITGLNSQAIAGGSLISSNRVITAAHNIQSGSILITSFTVVLGSINIMSGGSRIDSANIVLHPQYSPDITYLNDVAIIYMQSAVTFSANIAPVSIPSGTDESFAGLPAVASGFGRTESGMPSATLNRLDMTVLSHEQCSQLFGSLIQSTHICAAGATGTSICVGDSGGPLVVQSNNSPILVGITSFYIGECGDNNPDGFTRVSSFLNFINLHL